MARPNFDEIAKITRDLNYAYIAGYKRLIGRDDILQLKGGGDLKLYETVAQDDQVKSCVQQRISAVISRDWGVEPGDESKPAQQAAEFIEQELKNLQWDRINEKMLWGSFYGYSVGEIMWRRGDKIGIDDIKVRNRRRFNFGTDLQPKLITLEDPLGEDLPDQKFWHFCCGGDNDDDPYGRGLAHWLYWPTFFKRSDMRWWVTFLEKYAQPTRLGKYQPGASETDKDTLWAAMDAFGTNGKMMIPEGTMIELLEAARAGGADYKEMVDICNEAISKIVLSQTMTTDNGSSQSQANVHQDVKDDIVKADADLVCNSFNDGPVKWLIDWNFPGVAYPRVWRQMDAAVDLNAEADRDTKLQGLGIFLKPEAIAGRYGDDYLVAENKVQIPQLSGEQTTALISIVSQAKQGGWSPELVTGMINGAFPNWPGEAVAAITKNLGSDDTPVDQPAQPVDLNAVSAQFASAKILDEVALEFEVEFKLKQGSTKTVNGKQYVLRNSRWTRVEAGARKSELPISKPLSEAQNQKKAKVLNDVGIEVSKIKAEVAFEPEPVKAVERTHKELIADFFRNPKKSIADGLERESAARAKFAEEHASSKSLDLAEKAFEIRSKVKELAIDEGLPMVGSLIGNKIGEAVAGPAGGMLGDLIGSAVTRKGVEIARVYKKAADELDSDEAHSKATRLQKLKNVAVRTLQQLERPDTQEALEQSLVGDVGGWAIGNAVGKALSAAMPTGFVPLIGAAGAAMVLVPNVVQPLAAEAHKLVRDGVAPKDAVKKVIGNFVDEGHTKHKDLRGAMISQLDKLKQKYGQKNVPARI